MKYTHSVIPLASLAVFSAGCQSAPENNAGGSQTRTDPPNILFLVSEDNSAFLGAYGDPYAHTPNLDELAENGILYENAFANAPVCAPSRSTIITGMYANSLGSHQMRSRVEIPEEFRFFPYYLRQAGYYTVNRQKKDYNIVDQQEVWDDDQWWEYDDMLKDREDGQPFFAMFNTFMSHESKIHGERENDMLPYYRDSAIGSMTGTAASDERLEQFNYMHESGSVPTPPYHPDTPEMLADWARYYDCMSMMDDEMGEMLANMERDGLLENTIIFYFSDHGGVLGRSKRFTFESGLHVPFIVYVPEQYRHLAPGEPGSRTDRVISLLDLGPTALNVAGIEIPDHFQGSPFMGPDSDAEQEYAYGFRGRMDERYDFSRTVRDKNFRYIRNYMPHRPWGQRLNYLWRAESMGSWEQAYVNGETDEYESRFWESKPAEELYDIHADPHNVDNLAHDPEYREVLEEMRQANQEWMLRINDKNFIPEGAYLGELGDRIGYEYYTGDRYEIDRIMEIAELATMGDPGHLAELEKALQDDDPVVRYWGAVGARIVGETAAELRSLLRDRLEDPSWDVRIAAAEALYFSGYRQEAKQTLQEILQTEGFEPFGPMESIRAHAFNVVDIMEPADKAFFEDEIESIASRDDNGYDKRAADFLMTQ